jgi:transposase-like protein
MHTGVSRARSAFEQAIASPYWREEDARAVLARLETSGEQMAGFARRHGIGLQRLRWWRSRLSGSEKGTASLSVPGLVPVRVVDRAPANPAQTSAAIEIVVGRRTVRVTGEFATDLLLQVIRTLEGDAAC